MKTVLITGASSGIGKAAALLFAARGWNVIAGMRNPDAQQDDFARYPNILRLRLDVTDVHSIQSAISAGISKFGAIDALVNSAGYGLIGIFEGAHMEQIRKQYEVNVFGLMQVTQAVLPHMRERADGIVINLSSFGGVISLPFGSLYSSTKFAVEGFSEALALETAPLNIRVKIVEPGSIATNFRNNMDMIKAEIPAYGPLMQAFFPRFIKLTEHIEKNTAEDVAETIYQACLDESAQLRYVSGKDAQFFIDLKRDKADQELSEYLGSYFFNVDNP